MRFILLFVALHMFISWEAQAADPECDPASPNFITPVTVVPGVPLDRSGDNSLRFCSPLLDEDGDTMPADLVESCTVEVELPDGTWKPYATASGIGSGSRFDVTVIEKYDRQVRYFCDSAGGKGVVASATITFRAGRPSAPGLL